MRGFSLSELAITLMIATGWAALAMPLFSESRKNAQFLAFSSEITAYFTTAKQYAQLSGHSVTLDFDQTSPFLFEMTSHNRTIVRRTKTPTAAGHLPRLLLPEIPLRHPTTENPIVVPLSSTHGEKIIFGQRGSSSATLVFSQDNQRIFCIVIAGNTGRMRAYTYLDGAWSDFQ